MNPALTLLQAWLVIVHLSPRVVIIQRFQQESDARDLEKGYVDQKLMARTVYDPDGVYQGKCERYYGAKLAQVEVPPELCSGHG